jgi:hypothetical protein
MSDEAHSKASFLLPVLATAFNGNELAHGRFEDCKVAIWDYSNPEHFNSLWKSLEDGSIQNAVQVLIVWSKTPLDESLLPVNTTEHVSPLHWAACAAKEVEVGEPPIQVAILDLNPVAHQGEYLHVYSRNMERSRFRWLRLLQAAELFGEVASNGSFSADTFPGNAENLKRRLFPQIEQSRRNIVPDLFRDRIREKLTSPTSPDDRHAIANIVGPIVLLDGSRILNEFNEKSCYVEAGEQKKWFSRASTFGAASAEIESVLLANHRSALNSIFRTTKLLPPSSTNDSDGEKRQRERSEENAKEQIEQVLASLPQDVKLRLTLIDDQWHHGWYEWLKSIFPPKTAFTVSSDPKFLLNKLNALKEREADLRFKFDLTPHGTEADGKYADVLLLDLRLFSGNSAAEADFYRNLLPLCRKFEVAGPGSLVPAGSPLVDGSFCRIKHLAWSGFSTEELSNAEAWLAGGDGRTEANHRICLTLLPRLLALADMSLPILLFSSTGQGPILNKLQAYGNISTATEKPRFFASEPIPLKQLAEDRLAKALKSTLSIIQARLKCRELEKLQPPKEPNNSPPAKRLHVELYLDEHESQGANPAERYFAVGGCYAVFADGSDAQLKADQFDDLAVRRGIRYFKEPHIGPQPESGVIKSKSAHCRNELEQTVVKWHQAGGNLQLGFVRLSYGGTFQPQPGELFNPFADDNRFQIALETTIELFLSESLSNLTLNAQRANVTVSVFAGTRVKHFRDARDADEASFRFGFHKVTGQFLTTNSRDSLRRIVTSTITHHRARIEIVRALSVPLPYINENIESPQFYRNDSNSVSLSNFNRNDPLGSIAEWDYCFANGDAGIVDGFDRNDGRKVFVWSHRDGVKKHENISGEQLRVGQFVQIQKRRQHPPQARTIREVVKSLNPNLDELKCSVQERWRPDYRALHYVADQILPARAVESNYAKCFLGAKGDFDDSLTSELWDSLLASRHFDAGFKAEAIAKVSLGHIDVPNQVRHSARLLIARRISGCLSKLIGADFLRVASLLPLGKQIRTFNHQGLFCNSFAESSQQCKTAEVDGQLAHVIQQTSIGELEQALAEAFSEISLQSTVETKFAKTPPPIQQVPERRVEPKE